MGKLIDAVWEWFPRFCKVAFLALIVSSLYLVFKEGLRPVVSLPTSEWQCVQRNPALPQASVDDACWQWVKTVK